MDTLKDYISTKEASERYGIDQGYLAFLVTRGAIKGVKIARNWLLYLPSLEAYMQNRPKRGPKPGTRIRRRKQVL